VPTTVGRPRGRQGVHSGARGAAGDHKREITATLIAATVVIVFVLTVTKVGHVIDAATQHFMLYYAGVLALVGLTGSVLVSLLATDRIVMRPGHRVMAQALHRAFAFGTLAFLIIHITTEILAQRSHVIDAVVPFLSPYRTFYIGLGTIASDLIVLLVITGILRNRFTAHGKAWRWRAIHYTAYVAFVFAVLHGLLGGRAAKPYVDWSYGFAIALTALGLAIRFLAISLRPKESLNTSPVADRARPSGSSPLHAAAMSMAQAQLGGTVQVLPAGRGPRGAAISVPGTDSWAALPAPGYSPSSGPLRALGPAPAYAGSSAPPDAYGELGYTPLAAPPYGEDPGQGWRGRPYVTADQPGPAPARRPLYEPGYDGPPRFEGAPRGRGDVPQDELSSYPYGPGGRRLPSASPYAGDYADRTGPGRPEHARPRAAISAPPSAPRPADQTSGPMPRLGTGPMPRTDSGPVPRLGTGPMPRADSGPVPRLGTGPMPRVDSGPVPRLGTGPMPRPDTGPMPLADRGQPPRNGTGPLPRASTGAMSRPDSGPPPRPDTAPMPRPDTGPMPLAGRGQPPRNGTGPIPLADSGPMPRLGAAPGSRSETGPVPRAGTRAMPRPGTGPLPKLGTGPMPRPDTTSAAPRPGTGPMPRQGQPVPSADPATGPRTGSSPGAARPSRRAKSNDPRYHETAGPTGGDEWQ
jgi:hypothetical protein